MASCSLYKPSSSPLISRSELQTILLFERVIGDWVREVHKFTSKTKKGKKFVIFRNSSNTKLRGVKEFSSHLEAQGLDSSFLHETVFKSDKRQEIVSNIVGANVVARREALQWVEDVQNNKVRKLSSQTREVDENSTDKFNKNIRQNKAVVNASDNFSCNENNSRRKSPNCMIEKERDGDCIKLLENENQTPSQTFMMPLLLGDIDDSWMESMGNEIDSDEKDQDFENSIFSCEKEKADKEEDQYRIANDLSTVAENENLKMVKNRLIEKGKDNKKQDVFVGDFCEAWMDCFEAITELDNNLMKDDNNRQFLNESLDNRFLDKFTEEREPQPSKFLDKKEKENLNQKIARKLCDPPRNVTEEKENEMFKLLEDVLMKNDEISLNNIDTFPIKDLDNKKQESFGIIEESKSKNLFKFGDADTFKWDVKDRFLPKESEAIINHWPAHSSIFETIANSKPNEEEEKNMFVFKEQEKVSTHPMFMKSQETEAGSFFLPSFVKTPSEINSNGKKDINVKSTSQSEVEFPLSFKTMKSDDVDKSSTDEEEDLSKQKTKKRKEMKKLKKISKNTQKDKARECLSFHGKRKDQSKFVEDCSSSWETEDEEDEVPQ